MTISSETSTAGPYDGNGVTSVFPFEFKILDESHIRVVLMDAFGVSTDLSLDGGDYTVTGVGSEEGGDVIVAAPPTSGQKLTLLRNPPFTQETDLENQGAYNAEVVENRFDLIVMQIQTVKEETNRSLRVAPGQPAPSLALLQTVEANAAAAAASAALSQKWAENPVDDPVVPDGYSSLHHAAQSAEFAALSSEFANNPENIEVIPGSGLYSTKHFLAKVQALWNNVVTGIAAAFHGAASKDVPTGADEFGITDSASGFTLKRLTLANLVNWLHTVFGPSYLRGLITSKSSAFVISVGAGEIKGNGKLVINAAPFTKNLNAVWAAGSGNGGRLEAAALTANTAYFLHALVKDSDGSFDLGSSTSPTAPTIPVGYSWVGRFDWWYTNAAATAIVDYTQSGSTKYLSSTAWFTNTGDLGNALYTFPATCTVPAGIPTFVVINASVNANTGGSANLYINDADGISGAGGAFVLSASSGVGNTMGAKVRTNPARQFRMLLSFGGAGGSCSVSMNAVEDYTLNRIY